MKKLIPTILMTACGLAAVGGGSYAWFTQSNTVTATGLQIKAQVDSSLGIAKGFVEDANISSVNLSTIDIASGKLDAASPCDITFADSVATVRVPENFEGEGAVAPTTSSAGHAVNWLTVGTMGLTSADDATDITTHEDATTNELGTIKDNYVATEEVSVARRGVSTSYNLALTATISFGTTASNIAELDKAIRFGVMDDTTGAILFAETTEKSTLSGDVLYTINSFSNLANNKVYHFRLMMWYEGESTSCTVAAASIIQPRAATFTFTATDVGE